MKQRLLLSGSFFLCATLLAATPAWAQLFGPSDEQIAHGKAQDDQIRANRDTIQQLTQQSQASQQGIQQLQGQIRDLNDRVRNLTDSLARATGANEELQHQLTQTNSRLAQQERDFAYRLCVLSAQQLGADPNGLNCAATGTQAPAARPAPFTTSPQASASGSSLPPIMPNSIVPPAGGNPNQGRAPGVLGTLSGPAAQPAPAVSGDSRQFDSAMNLLGRAQYAEASAAFRSYADSHPEDSDLSPQALYWVGNIAYMRQDYANAARAFAEQIKKYPKSPRGADSMLRMGQALVAQGQTSNGCTAFRTITQKQYPNASPSTIDAALAARKANNCR
jgi:tol-pal system protein YbgF